MDERREGRRDGLRERGREGWMGERREGRRDGLRERGWEERRDGWTLVLY